ncbi:reverse transcriptase domain-containing protein [Tanacetum coccineum]
MIGKTHQGWVDELPQVLWAHRTTPKSSNRETPFNLVYSSEAMIRIEISIETRRIQDFDPKQNEKRRREDLDILEERREIASIKEHLIINRNLRDYIKPCSLLLQNQAPTLLGLIVTSNAELQGR